MNVSSAFGRNRDSKTRPRYSCVTPRWRPWPIASITVTPTWPVACLDRVDHRLDPLADHDRFDLDHEITSLRRSRKTVSRQIPSRFADALARRRRRGTRTRSCSCQRRLVLGEDRRLDRPDPGAPPRRRSAPPATPARCPGRAPRARRRRCPRRRRGSTSRVDTGDSAAQPTTSPSQLGDERWPRGEPRSSLPTRHLGLERRHAVAHAVPVDLRDRRPVAARVPELDGRRTQACHLAVPSSTVRPFSSRSRGRTRRDAAAGGRRRPRSRACSRSTSGSVPR